MHLSLELLSISAETIESKEEGVESFEGSTSEGSTSEGKSVREIAMILSHLELT